MASTILRHAMERSTLRIPQLLIFRTATTEAAATSNSPQAVPPANAPNTHFKITLRRSAISLGDQIKETLVSLGIHRRFQTVYHPHGPEVAGKILRVKELVEVENVPEHMVRTKQQMSQDRKATRGYRVVGSKRLDWTNRS